MNGSQLENLERLIQLLGKNIYEKELMAALSFTGNDLHKSEIEYQ